MRALKCLGHNGRFLCWPADFPNATRPDPYQTFLSRRQWEWASMNKRTDEECAVIKAERRRASAWVLIENKYLEVGREAHFIFSILFIALIQNCFALKMNGVRGERLGLVLWPLCCTTQPFSWVISLSRPTRQVVINIPTLEAELKWCKGWGVTQ